MELHVSEFRPAATFSGHLLQRTMCLCSSVRASRRTKCRRSGEAITSAPATSLSLTSQKRSSSSDTVLGLKTDTSVPHSVMSRIWPPVSDRDRPLPSSEIRHGTSGSFPGNRSSSLTRPRIPLAIRLTPFRNSYDTEARRGTRRDGSDDRALPVGLARRRSRSVNCRINSGASNALFRRLTLTCLRISASTNLDIA